MVIRYFNKNVVQPVGFQPQAQETRLLVGHQHLHSAQVICAYYFTLKGQSKEIFGLQSFFFS